ncbi:hypothetical protein G6F31_018186 [Rhizopus arrhizus]|nr:hypothetical protein G6F31_018186 [Rhizopus arrhizus]
MVSIASVAWSCLVKPIERREACAAPALVVITSTTFLKLASRPLVSVSTPRSITCSRMLKMSGCAFSISSSSSTQGSRLAKSMAARRLVPLLPSRLLITAVRSSTYSGTFNCAASQRAVSVLPTPGGPTKMAERVGVSPMA